MYFCVNFINLVDVNLNEVKNRTAGLSSITLQLKDWCASKQRENLVQIILEKAQPHCIQYNLENMKLQIFGKDADK